VIECGETDDDTGKKFINEEVVGQGTTEKESSLRCEGRTHHDNVEMPDDHSVHLALSVATAIND